MTLRTLPGPLYWPGLIARRQNNNVAAGNLATVAAGNMVTCVFCASQDMVISHVGFLISTATGSPTAVIRIETLDATGIPSGALWGTNTTGTTGVLTASTWNLQALTAVATISRGQLFAVRFDIGAGTNYIMRTTGSELMVAGVPYIVTAVNTKNILTGNACLALGSSSTSFYSVDGCWPFTAATVQTFNNTSSARRGVRFQVPFKCQCSGMVVHGATIAGDFNAMLMSDAGVELNNSSTAFDGDTQPLSVGGQIMLIFDNPVTLYPNTWYRAVIEPTSVTNVQSVVTVALPSSNYKSSMLGGANFGYTTYASGVWDDTAVTAVPLIDLTLSQLDDGIPPARAGLQALEQGLAA